MALVQGRVDTRGNRIEFSGRLSLVEFRHLLAAIHNKTTRESQTNLVLDFRPCEAAFPGPMAALCAMMLNARADGIGATLELPKDLKLRNLFLNAGWAHLIDPVGYDGSKFRGYTHVPSVQFISTAEQRAAVDKTLDAMLCSLSGLARGDLAAIEWSINEITDNVLVHARSLVGGVLHLNNYKRQGRIEFVVADPGVGIPETLRQGHPELTSDALALDMAIREGVTRDKTIGQGNGLHGTFKVAEVSRGYFHVHSGFARLDYQNSELHVRSEQIRFPGTLVVAGIDCSNPKALGNALRFDGEQHRPTDYIEMRYEDPEADALVFNIAKESTSLGSRVAGEPVRIKLTNLLVMNPGRRVIVDMADVPLVSSSFADEVFAKLFVQLGPLEFMHRIAFRFTADTVRSLIDKAVVQRTKTGL